MGYNLNPFTRKLDDVGTGGAGAGVGGVSLTGNTAGVMALVSSGTMYLAGGNNVTLSQNANSITISGGAAGAADGVNAFVVNGGASTASTTLALSNSNNVTFGLNAGTITASASFNQTAQTQNLHNVSLSGNTAGVMAQISSGTMTLAGGNNVTLSQNGNAVTISGPNTVAQTAFVLSNSNGVSFGTNGSTVTATVRTDYQSAGAYLTTAMQSNAATISNVNLSAGTTSSNLSAMTFANSNGVSFGLDTGANAGRITATVATNYQSQGAYLTTAMQSDTPIVQSINGSSGTFSLNTGSSLSSSRVGNAITFGLASNITTALQSAGAYLTTAMQSNAVTLSNIKVSGGTTSNNLSAITFADGNGVSFGLNAGTMTATVKTDYQTAGAYLTTAMASNRGTDFVQANAAFAGTNASGTIASNGISVSVNPAAAGVGVIAGTRTATTAGNILFDTGNGITFGLNAPGGSIMTASHNGLTTARASTDAIGLATAQTNVTWTANSAGLSLNAGGYAGTNTATTGNISVTLNTSGISINAPAFLTTAAQSSVSNISGVVVGTASNAATNQTAQLSGNVSFANGSGVSFFSTVSGATSGVAASVKTDYQSSNANYLTSQSNQNITAANGGFAFQTLSFSNLNGISFGTSAGSAITASHNGLTTARASNDAVGLNTAQTNVTWTVNSSGISLNASAYLTTAMASNRGTDFVQANAAFAGTNASGTIASNGISVSVNAGGGATPVASASNGSFSFTTLGFSNANNVTFGTSAGNIITASVAAPGAAAENNWFALTGNNTAGNTTASGSTIGLSGINLTLSGTNGSGINISAPATSSLSATGQVSISTNGSTISIGVPSAVTVSRYNEFKESPIVAGNIGQGSLHLQPWIVPNVQMDRVVVNKIFSNASNSSFSFTVSDWVGIYTRNASTLSLLASASANTNFSGSGTVGSYLSYGGGLKGVTMGLTRTLTEGMYWIGVINRTTTGGGAGHTLNQALVSQVNTSNLGLMGVATNATNQVSLGLGVYSATTSSMPNSIAFTEIQGNSSVFLRPPSVYFVSGTI